MSSSLIRCLLAVYALSESFEVIASKDVAHLLGVKRPTIHRSLEVLQEKDLIQKELYGDVHLTEAGRARAQQLEAHDELRFLGSLRMLMNPAHKENKMIFMVLDGEKVRTVSRVVNEVTGGLDQPDSGILFTVPISYVEGLGKYQ